MEISYKSTKLKKMLEDSRSLTKKFGNQNASKIVQRINELEAAPILAEMPIGAGTHPLENNRKGHYAVYLKHPFRLIFELIGDYPDPKEAKKIEILEIIDYH